MLRLCVYLPIIPQSEFGQRAGDVLPGFDDDNEDPELARLFEYFRHGNETSTVDDTHRREVQDDRTWQDFSQLTSVDAWTEHAIHAVAAHVEGLVRGMRVFPWLRSLHEEETGDKVLQTSTLNKSNVALQLHLLDTVLGIGKIGEGGRVLTERQVREINQYRETDAASQAEGSIDGEGNAQGDQHHKKVLLGVLPGLPQISKVDQITDGHPNDG